MYATIKGTVDINDVAVNTVDVLNPKGTFVNGKRVREWTMKALPALSGRLLPEFDRRRNIKDMFTRKPSFSKSADSQPEGETITQISAGREPTGSKSPVLKKEIVANGTVQDLPTKQIKPTLQSPPVIRSKRSATEEDVRKSTKRAKPEGKGTATAIASTKGQQSLKGFFKPKMPVSSQAEEPGVNPFASPKSEKHETEQPITANVPADAFSPPTQQSQATTTSEEQETAISLEVPSQATPDNQSPTKSLTENPLAKSASPLVDPIVSKESWMKLFTKPAPPRCEGHDEPCVVYKTKKSGMNCGREFWLCPR